jgi:hypothetical protein
MKNNKSKYIDNTKNSDYYYFLKPFEISSAYNSFIGTWKRVNRVYKEIDDVEDAALMQSNSEKSKFGFISCSSWKTKEAFVKSTLQYTVLNYHSLLSGDGAKSAVHSLYKIISQENNAKSKKDNTVEIILFETELSSNKEVQELWDKICSGKTGNIVSSYLYKSVFKKSKYRYLGFLYYKDNNVYPSDKSHTVLKKGYNIHSALYKKVLKY